MSMQGDCWAVSPLSDAIYYRGVAASAGSTPYTLLQTVAGMNGVGYKVSITSTGADSDKTFTLVGHAMGTPAGTSTTEVITGPATATVSSTNYYDRITSITPSGNMAGNISCGLLGTSVALPRTRVRGVYYVATGSAGIISLTEDSASGSVVLRVNTPASATAAQYVLVPGGILTTRGGTDAFGVVALTNVTFCTIVCG